MAADLCVALTMEAAWHKVPGGTARVAIDLAAALDARDDTAVTAIAAFHRGDPGPDWMPSVPVVHQRLPRVVLYESWSRWSWPRIRDVGADVVHSTTVIPPPRGNRPLVVSVHDLAFRRHPDRFPPRARRLYERSWRRVLERADAVLCPSVATSADLRAGGLAADLLHLVPLGHDPVEVFQADLARVRATYGVGERFVMAAGTLEPRKNLPALLEAFALLPEDAVLVLVGPVGWGDGPSRLTRGLSEEIRRRVIFTGHVSREDLSALYSAATVFCYPSLLEGFGLPVLEAMSYGTPVVTSIGTATEEVAGRGALMVDPSSPTDIAGALRDLWGDSRAAEQLSVAGRERAQEFSWARVAEATRDVYESLIR